MEHEARVSLLFPYPYSVQMHRRLTLADHHCCPIEDGVMRRWLCFLWCCAKSNPKTKKHNDNNERTGNSSLAFLLFTLYSFFELLPLHAPCLWLVFLGGLEILFFPPILVSFYLKMVLYLPCTWTRWQESPDSHLLCVILNPLDTPVHESPLARILCLS